MAVEKMLYARFRLGQFPGDLFFASRIGNLHRDGVDAPSAQTGQGILGKHRSRRKQNAASGIAHLRDEPHARSGFLDWQNKPAHFHGVSRCGSNQP